MTPPPLLPKVVEVIDPDRIVINWGSSNGVKPGQRFLVYKLGPEIIDPDNGQSLGKLEIVRGTGKAVHVQEKMTTLKSDRTAQRRVKTRNSSLLFGTTEESVTDELSFDEPAKGDLAKPI